MAENSRMRQLARNLGIADRVHFHGEVDDHELRQHYLNTDVFVLACRQEGLGIVDVRGMWRQR